MSIIDINTEIKKNIPWKLVVVFICFSVAIIIVGISFYLSQRNRLFTQNQNDLTAIAFLKVNQIENWHAERLGDAATIRDNGPLINTIKQYFRDKNQPEIKTQLIKWMESVYNEYDCGGVLLIDTIYKVRLSVLPADTVAGDLIRDELKTVMLNNAVIMTDLHKTNKMNYVHLDLLIPLIDNVNNEKKAFGVMILRIDPGKKLFPLIQSWPTQSKSSETLLVRKEGDSVLYLNELRHKNNTSLNLKAPLSDLNLLAAKAVNGKYGVVEGKDYRGIPVVGFLTRIADLPWYMVAKVDKKEILTPLKKYIIISVIGIVLLILINASIFGFWIWNQRLTWFKQQLQNEISKNQTEEKLRETNEYLSNLVNYANVPIIVWDTSLLITRFNHAFEELSCYNEEEVTGQKIDILFNKEKSESSLELINKAVSGERLETVEIEIQRKDGGSRIVLWNSANIHDKDGITVIATIAQGHDITERKQAEEALRENEKRLREAQEMSHLGFWLWDIKTGNVEWSDEVYRIFCLDPETFNPKIDSILELSPWPEDNQRDKELIRRAVESQEPGSYEQKFLRPDKSIGYYYSTFRGDYDNNGDLISIVGTVLDITERKQAEDALRESEDKFKYIFDHSVIGKSITLPSGEIQVNKAFCDMLGYTSAELTKARWQDISYRDDIEKTEKIMQSLIAGEKDSVRFIKRYLHKNGSVVWTDVGSALRRDEDGKALYFMTAINNITDRIHAEEALRNLNDELELRVAQRTEQLQTANKELEAFSYSVSHDLRAPLRSVHGYTKILLEEYDNKLDFEGKRLCGIISSSATQMGELIDDLLSFSRIGRSNLNPSKIDMKKKVRLLFESMTSPTERERINISIDNLDDAYGDVALVGQVWINLISNAIKYSSKTPSSEIFIRSKKENGMIVYSVKDNGVGFDMQYKHKLFGVFQRLHSENEFEGNGVGLAIVQRIIMKHGGRVWADGEVEKGATFYFSLPAYEIRDEV
jgi:PAS domain S-box-containing protein